MELNRLAYLERRDRKAIDKHLLKTAGENGGEGHRKKIPHCSNAATGIGREWVGTKI